MTEQEKLIRALEACKAQWPQVANAINLGHWDGTSTFHAVLRALNDLDKPIPDPDEAWRPFMEAVGYAVSKPLPDYDREYIARIKAARHLMPKED